jgi:flagellin-like protein
MRKLLKSRKALSPVVAAIILIAVTVAVSIAVAAWMGALTIGFMGTGEGLKITNVRFTDTAIEIDVMNVGSGPVTISEVKVDGTSYSTDSTTNKLTFEGEGFDGESPGPTLAKGKSGTIIARALVGCAWSKGLQYDVIVITAAGNQFPYTARAPSY